MRPFRILGFTALALVVLIIGVAIALATVDTRVLIAPLEERIESITGREILIEGAVRIVPSFVPTIVLEDVSIANAPWGSDKEMLRARVLEAEVALWPLVRRQVDVRRFTLVEPSILLETDADGRGNWVSGEAKAGAVASDPVSAAASAFALGEFGVDKGEVHWRDGRTGKSTLVRIESLTLQAPDPESPMSVAFVGAVDKLPLVVDGRFGSLAQWQANAEPWPVDVQIEAGSHKAELEAKLRQTPEGIAAEGLRYASGETRLAGSLVYIARPSRPLLRFALSAETLVPGDLVPAGIASTVALDKPATKGAADAAPVSATTVARTSGGTPLPLDLMHAVDAQGSLAVDRLVLAPDRILSKLRAKLALENGKLDVTDFAVGALGGSGEGRLTIDAQARKDPQLALNVAARGVDVDAMMQWAGTGRELRGGKADISMDVNARGATSRDWAASLSGLTTVKAEGMRWLSADEGASAAFDALASLVDRKRKPGGATEIRCAAARLPWSNGVARFERGIAVEMPHAALAASGTIDLRDETLDVMLHPRVSDRNAVDLSRLAGAIRISGPIDAPQLRIDAPGSAAAIAQLGAIAGRRGSARIAAILGAGQAGSATECDDALNGVSKPTAPAAAQGASAPAAKGNPGAKSTAR